jgi:hypothetical protein
MYVARCVFSALVFFWIAPVFYGQQSVNSATVTGTVQDGTGAPVPSVTVTITNVDRNQPFRTQSDERGRFRFAYLPVGEYALDVRQPGFATFTGNLTLSVGQAMDVPILLSVAALSVEVAVSSELPAVETARTQLAETILPREITTLPLNGRNYLDLALLSPAVSRTNTGNNERFAETSAVPGTGITIAGQRNLANGFVVDGLSANDDAADLAGTFFSPEVIREFQVITSGGIAEFGRASSGVVNVLTQSGTNTWRGSAYGFLRNQRFDATNVFAQLDPATGRRRSSPFTQAQYGMSAGGPLRRDKTFLFSNFEQERLHRSGFITISPANVAAVNAVLDQVQYGPPRVVTGEYPTGDHRTNVFGKVDHNIGPSHRLAVRYSFFDIISPNARNVGGLSTVSRGTVVADRDQTVAANDVLALSATAVNEARLQFTRSRFSAPGNDLVGPAITIASVANLGASTSSPTARDTDLFEAANNYSVQHGPHFLKVGADLLYNRVNIVFPSTLYGSYSFSSLANFQAGNYTTFAQAFGRIDWFQTNPNLGWFIQDEWKPTRAITVNAGLRHDVQWLAAGVSTQRENFAPRIGLAYAPGDRKTVLRLGFGQFYDRIPLRAVANALRGAGSDYVSISLQRTQIGAPVFPNKLPAVVPGILFNLATIDPNIKNSYGLQTSLQIEREVTSGIGASLGFIHRRGVHIIMQRNLNVPTMTAAQDPVNLGRPNPKFGNITQYSGQGDSYYDGMTLSLQNRSSRRLSGRVSYTLSKAIDNTGNAFFSSPQNNFNIRDDRGLSDNDQRHRLTVSGQFNLPSVVQLSAIYTYGSPFPFNVVTGGQTLQTTAARVAGAGRNTGVGFNYASLDLRANRSLKIAERMGVEILVEAFNVLNRTNYQFPNNTFGGGTTPLPSFRQATAAADPRQVQLGLRLMF